MSKSHDWGLWSNIFTYLAKILAFREETLPSLSPRCWTFDGKDTTFF